MIMIRNIRLAIANWIAPHDWPGVMDVQKSLDTIEEQINQRVAETLMKMDPFEPFLKKFHGIFSEQFVQPEDGLSQPGKIQLFAWAYGNARDPSFKHLTNWLENVQANNTLRKAKNDYEWFFGRCAIVMMELYTDQVSRLARQYEELVLKKSESFNSDLTVE